jgi:hypothetical protein
MLIKCAKFFEGLSGLFRVPYVLGFLIFMDGDGMKIGIREVK